MLKSFSLLLLMLALAACGEPAQVAAPGAQEKPTQRVMEEQFQAIDKARAVEKSLQDAADKQRKAIEDAGG